VDSTDILSALLAFNLALAAPGSTAPGEKAVSRPAPSWPKASPELRRHAAAPAHHDAVLAEASRWAQGTARWSRCADFQVGLAGSAPALVLEEASTAMWERLVTVAGCGTERVVRVSTVRTGGFERTKVLGGALGHIDLLAKAQPIALRGSAAAFQPACAQGAVVDTELTSDKQRALRGNPWTERWTVAGCGQFAAVTLRYVPKGRGAIGIEAEGAELLTPSPQTAHLPF
jgi:hypothetical protein